MKLFAILFALVLSGTLYGQDEADLEQTEMRDETRKGMLNQNNSDANGSLIAGGAYYVSNPSPTYKVDMKKAYLNPQWQEGEVRLINGDFYKAQLRYRVIDQAFEVMHEGEAYELKQDQLQGVYLGEDRFVLMPDPLFKKKGAQIYELHYNSKQYQLIEYHGAQWQDPPEQNMFDTRDQHRTIKDMKQLIFRTSNGTIIVKSPKDFLRAIGLDKKSEEAKYAKQEGLKLNDAADIVRFLEYLEK